MNPGPHGQPLDFAGAEELGAPDCDLELVEEAGQVFDGVDPAPIAERFADFPARHLVGQFR